MLEDDCKPWYNLKASSTDSILLPSAPVMISPLFNPILYKKEFGLTPDNLKPSGCPSLKCGCTLAFFMRSFMFLTADLSLERSKVMFCEFVVLDLLEGLVFLLRLFRLNFIKLLIIVFA